MSVLLARQDTAGPSSHDRHWRAGTVQAVSPPGTADLGPGYLEPGLLPVDLIGEAYARMVPEFGAAALSYGENRGALPFREAVADRATALDGTPCAAENILVTAGSSHALHLLGTALAAPGQQVLVERTGYDFGRAVLRDCGLVLREVATDADGIVPEALDEALRTAAGQVAFVVLTPTFHNPTGTVMPLRRRLAVLEVAARHQVLLVEDDAYAELDLDGTGVPPSLASLAGQRGVVRLRTISKVLGPGLRLGWLQADRTVVDRLASRGLLVSGGSANHTCSLAVATLLRDGGFDRHLDWLRSRLRDRRDALHGAVTEHLRGTVEVRRPQGGFFLWLEAAQPEPVLLAAARECGVVVAAGSRFGRTGTPAVRLSYSFNSPSLLRAAAARLAAAWKGTS
ncbi:aminotransferase class I/II [Lentzea pudingi]|uniref:Aminotransferase class I/II n=1 Tax=Lentzea pudingi TaxID=1789439 RepID=A0ABQ2ICL9_9PSEU|nr:aminotransferase class I/II-fold pyridoxal phosphate-dependent enzyme [Lentzea pudingi]GGN03884.1 aminotransferase class I/II [Lentzea pudingi]